jgi:coenzyme F420-reducing hydrogenase alpha subunit
VSESPRTRTIRVGQLARVEGEGSMHVTIEDGLVTDARFAIFEPPRFFEALLRGRGYDEAPDITARICGICPVAYQMSAVHAIERVFGVTVDGPLRELRRLLYCGEWIESHALHVFMLHAPDFLGFDDAFAMGAAHPGVVERALSIKQAGNAVVATVGGREVHPINVRVGGFHRLPDPAALRGLLDPLRRSRDDVHASLAWLAALPFPEARVDHELVALRHPDEYPFNEGRIVSTAGLDIDADAFLEHVREEQVPYSTALQARLIDRDNYLVGPLARYAHNVDRLPPGVRAAAAAAGLGDEERNPFRSILVRAVELLFAVGEAIRIIEAYAPPAAPVVPFAPRAGEAAAATEAPRGLLVHRYRLAADGRIEAATIIPPTSQNQRSIERDLRTVIEAAPELDDAALTHRCEQTIRNHDPCISCATHFLRLDVDRR